MASVEQQVASAADLGCAASPNRATVNAGLCIDFDSGGAKVHLNVRFQNLFPNMYYF